MLLLPLEVVRSVACGKVLLCPHGRRWIGRLPKLADDRRLLQVPEAMRVYLPPDGVNGKRIALRKVFFPDTVLVDTYYQFKVRDRWTYAVIPDYSGQYRSCDSYLQLTTGYPDRRELFIYDISADGSLQMRPVEVIEVVYLP